MAPPRSFTPAMVARHDQDMAEINTRLASLVAGIRDQIAEFGVPQATANTALMLTDYSTPRANAEMLLGALMLLAQQS